MDRRSLNAKLAKAKSLLTDGERHIAARRKIIGRLSAVGAEADPCANCWGTWSALKRSSSSVETNYGTS